MFFAVRYQLSVYRVKSKDEREALFIIAKFVVHFELALT